MAIMPSVGNSDWNDRETKPKKGKASKSSPSGKTKTEDVPRGVGGRYIMKDGVRVPRTED